MEKRDLASPEFSVVVPVYNAAHCLNEFFGQFEKLDKNGAEFIFVDDGSSDGSSAMLNSFCRGSKFAQLVTIGHAGVSAARNAGIARARGRYVMFLDADDSYVPGIFSVLREKLCKSRADIIVFGANVRNYDKLDAIEDISPRNIIYRDFEPYALFCENGARPYVWNCAYRLQFIRENNIRFNPGISLGEDHLFQFTAFPRAHVIQFISDKLYCYNYLKCSSAMIMYLRDPALRYSAHITVVSAVLNLSATNGLDSAQELLWRWVYDLLSIDVRKLNFSQFKVALEKFRTLLKENDLKISGLKISCKLKFLLNSCTNLFLQYLFKLRYVVTRHRKRSR